MSKRVLVLVTRMAQGTSVTDVTPTVVFEHEVPLLEEIHGEGACQTIRDIDDLVDREGAVANRKALIEEIVRANGLGQPFAGDAQEEYGRLTMKYGMHTEVKMTVVEKVYGRFATGSFKAACGDLSYEAMTTAQLREKCEQLGIEFKSTAKKADLIGLLDEAAA